MIRSRINVGSFSEVWVFESLAVMFWLLLGDMQCCNDFASNWSWFSVGDFSSSCSMHSFLSCDMASAKQAEQKRSFVPKNSIYTHNFFLAPTIMQMVIFMFHSLVLVITISGDHAIALYFAHTHTHIFSINFRNCTSHQVDATFMLLVSLFVKLVVKKSQCQCWFGYESWRIIIMILHDS